MSAFQLQCWSNIICSDILDPQERHRKIIFLKRFETYGIKRYWKTDEAVYVLGIHIRMKIFTTQKVSRQNYFDEVNFKHIQRQAKIIEVSIRRFKEKGENL